jgi:hypothetical protein
VSKLPTDLMLHPARIAGLSTCLDRLQTAWVNADSSALFVEPKWAQFLQSSGVTEALGRPMPMPSASPAMLDGATERII